jgi:hypothetical protein
MLSLAVFVGAAFFASGLLAVHSASTANSRVQTLTGPEVNVSGLTSQTTGLPTGFTYGGYGALVSAKTGLTAGAFVTYIMGLNSGKGPATAWGFEYGTGTSMPFSNGVIYTSTNGYSSGASATQIVVSGGYNFGELGATSGYEPICMQGYEGWVCI